MNDELANLDVLEVLRLLERMFSATVRFCDDEIVENVEELAGEIVVTLLRTSELVPDVVVCVDVEETEDVETDPA